MLKVSTIGKMADIFVATIRKLAEDDHPSAGMIFYCPDDQTVLLTQRSKDMSSPGTWDIQGGRHDDADDSTMETATREATEEIEELPGKKHLMGKHVLPKNSKGNEYVIYIYSIPKKEKETWTPKIKLDHESSQHKWFPYHKLPEKTHFDMSWLKKAIEELS